MKLRHRPAIALLCLSLLLTGCSGDDEKPEVKPPATSAAVTTPSETPTAEAWEEKSEAGIAAFLEHWAKLTHEASSTGDVKPLKAISLPTCRSCNSTTAFISGLYADGGRIEGEPFELLKISEVPKGTSLDHPTVAVTLERATETVYRVGQPKSVSPGGSGTLSFDLRWTSEGWRIAQFGRLE